LNLSDTLNINTPFIQRNKPAAGSPRHSCQAPVVWRG